MSKTEGMTLTEKLSYYWYYYKWHAFAVACAVLALVYTLVSCYNRVAPDLSVLIVSDVYIDAQYQQAFNDEYSKHITDANEDGKKIIKFTIVQFSDYTSGTMNPELESASEEHLKANLMTAQNQMIIFKDNVKDYLEGFGTFSDLSVYENDDGYFKIDSDDKELLGLPTSDYNVCIRITPAKTEKEQGEELKMYDNAYTVLEKMIK